MPKRAGEETVGASVQSVSGVERALDVLRLFTTSDTPTLGVTEISQSLDLSKAVVHRILSAFRSKGFIEIDEASHRYRLGAESLYLGLAYLDRIDVRAIAHEAMQGLVADTDETATMSIRVGWNRVYLDQVTPNRDVKMVVQLGRPFPLHTGASSKALLAFLSEHEQKEYLRQHELVPLTPLTITDPEVLRVELAAIRQRGYAVSTGERDASAAAVAAPVFNRDEHVVAVISVCGPVERFSSEIDEASRLLLEATGHVSRRLGHRQR
jgi:DNA-binding IclR family transcriptional regulator